MVQKDREIELLNESVVPSVHDNIFEIDENVPREDVDLLVIGDSIIKHINEGGVNIHKCVLGGRVSDIREELIELNRSKRIKKVIMHVGTNNFPNQSPSQVLRKILALVKEVRDNMPDTKLLVSAILPKHADSLLYGINCINYNLRASSRALGFKFISNSQFVKNGDADTSLMAQDGLHLSRMGTVHCALTD